MKTNAEMKKIAWDIVRGRWFWRLLMAAVLLNGISQIVQGVIGGLYKHWEIKTYTAFLLAKFQAMNAGLDLTVPSTAAGWQMIQATAFELFVSYLFASIMAFGIASTTLKATKNDEKNWLSSAFGGYRRPLELFALIFVMNIFVSLWSLLFLIPGIIALYRYRQAWYVKAENPDWGVLKCLSESARMMKGHKAEAFSFDLSFIWWLFGAVVLIVGIALVANRLPFLVPLLGIGFTLYVAFSLCYYLVGRTVFYHEVKALAATPQTDSAE